MAIFPHQRHRWAEHESWWMRHSLSIVLVTILVLQSVAFHLTRLPEWTADQLANDASTALWPGYWLHYASEWFVSVLADTYGALLLVVLTKWFYETGSAESQDADQDAGQDAGSTA